MVLAYEFNDEKTNRRLSKRVWKLAAGLGNTRKMHRGHSVQALFTITLVHCVECLSMRVSCVNCESLNAISIRQFAGPLNLAFGL